MKRKLFFFLFTIPVFVQGQSSVYHPFPDSNAVWIVSHGCNNFCSSCGNFGCSSMRRYDMTGDTIINGRAYHKIGITGTANCSCSWCNCLYLGWNEEYIREDSAKRIWKLDMFSMTDTLLYDFNLSVADTLNSMLSNYFMGGTYVIHTIDSVYIGNNYRKKYYYSSDFGSDDSCSTFLIEGIGGGGGLFSPLCGGMCFESGARLLCFKQNDTIQYYSSSGICPYPDSSCSFTVSTPQYYSENNFFVFPNPVTGQFTIYNSRFTIEDVEVYSPLGEKIYSQKQTADSQKQKIDVDTHSWSVGVYFVRIKISEGVVVKKIIKQ